MYKRSALLIAAAMLLVAAACNAIPDPCKQINDIAAVGCGTGFDPGQAAKQAGSNVSMGEPIDPMINQAIELALKTMPYTKSVTYFFTLHSNQAQVFKILDGSGKLKPLPVFIFANNSDQIQKEIAIDMMQAIDDAGQTFQIEVGIGPSPFSVIEASANGRTVLGFDPQYYGSYTVERDMQMSTDYSENGGVGGIFSINAWDITTDPELPKANIAYSFAPFPNLTKESLELTCKLAEVCYVIPSPQYGNVDQETLRQNTEVNFTVTKMNLGEIKNILGTNYSQFLTSGAPEDGLYEVIIGNE